MPAELLLSVLDKPRLQAFSIEGLEVHATVHFVGLAAGNVGGFVCHGFSRAARF